MRKKKIETETGDFLRKYGRKKYPGHNPNDRQYDRNPERKIKSMDPEELDELMRGAPEEDTDKPD